MEIRPVRHLLIKTSSFSPVYAQENIEVGPNEEIEVEEILIHKLGKRIERIRYPQGARTARARFSFGTLAVVTEGRAIVHGSVDFGRVK